MSIPAYTSLYKQQHIKLTKRRKRIFQTCTEQSATTATVAECHGSGKVVVGCCCRDVSLKGFPW
eukprot:1899513-Heterocapsa_arctica.AAC.1